MKVFLLFILTVSCAHQATVSRNIAQNKSCIQLLTSLIKRQYVNSLDDFRYHTRLHISRVVNLGIGLHKSYPDRYGHISQDLVREFLSIHDNSKLVDEGILEDLYYFYGRNNLSSTERDFLKNTVDRLNLADTVIRYQFLKERNLIDQNGNLTADGELLIEIEKIADLVDRGSGPVSREEFGRPMAPASEFISDDLKGFARELENNYHNIVEGLEFQRAQ